MNIVSHLADTRTFLPFVHMRIYRTFARSYFTFSCPHKSLPAHIISWENDKDKDTYAFLVFPHRLFPSNPLKEFVPHTLHKKLMFMFYITQSTTPHKAMTCHQGNLLPHIDAVMKVLIDGCRYIQQHYWLCNAFAAGMCDVYNIFRHVVIWDHCGCFGKHVYLYETNSITQLALSGQLVLTSI